MHPFAALRHAMAYHPCWECKAAVSPGLQDRIASASTIVAGATLAVSVGLLVWAFLKTH
jgi:hypothetical protein